MFEAAPPGSQGIGIMQAQDLDVGNPQLRSFDRGQNFRERRKIPSRKDVLAYPRVGRARPVHAADRVQQCYPVRRQQRLELIEEHFVVVDADVLEHADRNDSVIVPALLAVVAQMEFDAIGQSRRCSAAHRYFVLLRRKGQTSYPRAAFAGQVKRKAAPPRSDIEHPLAWSDQQLCSDVPLLVELSGIEVVGAVTEIGAGILPVLIEERCVEFFRQVVVMGDVSAGARKGIILMKPAQGTEGTI